MSFENNETDPRNAYICKKKKMDNGDLKIYYALSKQYEEDLIEYKRIISENSDKDTERLKKEENEKLNQKVVYSYTILNGEKNLKEFLNEFHEKEKAQRNMEKIARIILIKVYNFISQFKNYKKEYKNNEYFSKLLSRIEFLFFSNSIIIKYNKEGKIENVLINIIESLLIIHKTVSKFGSGTFLSQAPRNQRYMFEKKKNNNDLILKTLGFLTKYIINNRIDKYFEIYSIPLFVSNECKSFLRTCFLNLKYFEYLKELPFLNEKIEIEKFHYSNEEDKSLSALSSYLLAEKHINDKEEEILFTYKSIISLNSFCIKPEEKKIMKKDKKIFENRKTNKLNNPDGKTLPFDSIILTFLTGPKENELEKDEYSIEEIIEKNIQKLEKKKENDIKKELQSLPIYTYPIAKNN